MGYLWKETPTMLPYPLEPEKLSPEVPAVLEGREETRQTEQRSTCLRVSGPTTGSLPPFRIWTTPSCALSPSCAQRVMSWRGKEIAWLKKTIKVAAQNGSPCPPLALCTAASLVVWPSLSLSLRPEKLLLPRWGWAGLMGDTDVDTLILVSADTSGNEIQAKRPLLLWWCYDVQSGLKQSGLMVIRRLSCCAQLLASGG